MKELTKQLEDLTISLYDVGASITAEKVTAQSTSCTLDDENGKDEEERRQPGTMESQTTINAPLTFVVGASPSQGRRLKKINRRFEEVGCQVR